MYYQLIQPLVYFLLGISFSNAFLVPQQPLSKSNEAASTPDRMIVGLRGSWSSCGTIIIKAPLGNNEWEWKTRYVKSDKYLPLEVRSCITRGESMTEVKWAANGTKIVAVVGYAAIVLNYAPENPELDQRIDFAICVADTHTLELLPDDFLAVATSGSKQSDGFKIYDLRISQPLLDEPSPRPVQTIRGFPAVHGLLWDETSRKLWAIGNDKSPAGTEGPSQGVLRGYAFNPDPCRREILDRGFDEYPVSVAEKLTTEWGPETNYWDGPHDLTGIPNTRKILITTDLHVVGFDVESRTWLSDAEVDSFLNGFVPVGNRANITRSDIKSISMNKDGRLIYVQSKWKEWFGEDVRIIEKDHKLTKFPVDTSVYKARWFMESPGWPAAH